MFSQVSVNNRHYHLIKRLTELYRIVRFPVQIVLQCLWSSFLTPNSHFKVYQCSVIFN